MTRATGEGPASAGPLFDRFRAGLCQIDRVSRILVIASMAAMSTLVVTQVVFRYALASSIDWAEEIARLAFVWAMFLAIPHGIRLGVHVGIDSLVVRFPTIWKDRLFRLSAALGAILMVVILYYSVEVTVYTWPELMPTVNFTASSYYVAVLIAAAHSILHLALLTWGGPDTWGKKEAVQ